MENANHNARRVKGLEFALTENANHNARRVKVQNIALMENANHNARRVKGLEFALMENANHNAQNVRVQKFVPMENANHIVMTAEALPYVNLLGVILEKIANLMIIVFDVALIYVRILKLRTIIKPKKMKSFLQLKKRFLCLIG
jgi:hypothetical protein